MLEIPEEIKELFRSNNLTKNTQKKFKLTFYDDKIETLYPYETLWPSEDLFPAEHEGNPWLVIENDRIETESLTITESLSESEDLEFGSCESTMFEIVVADVAQDVTGREFTLTVEIGGYEMALGIYTVESFVRLADRRKKKITAYDRMRWFDIDVANWYNDLVLPMSLKTFRNSLCSYIGIKQSQQDLLFDSMQLTKTIEPQQISGIDILKAVCQINGCFGHIDKMGELVYVHLQETGLYPSEDLFPFEELYPSEFGGDGNEVEVVNQYRELTYEDYLVEGITGVTIRQQEGDVGANVGDGDNPYVIEGNFLVYGKSPIELLTIGTNLLNYISGRVYRPANLKCNGMPWLEVGDGVRIITRDDIVETFVMKRTISGCQAMTDTIESTGSPKREEIFGINKQIIQLEGKSAVIIKNVEEVSAKLTDLKDYTEAEFKITSDRITSEVKRLDDEDGKLSTKIEQTADKITLEVSQKYVANGEISSKLSLEPGKVTFDTNRLIINSTNFKLNEKGDATFSGKITGGTINIGNVFKVDSSGNTSITGDHFTWTATNSSLSSDGTLICNSGKFSGAVEGATINVADGKFKVDASGKVSLTGADLDGCMNTGTMGADYINANYITTKHIVSDQGAELYGDTLMANISAGHADIQYIECDSIYSRDAGEEWSDIRLKEDFEHIPINLSNDFIKKLRPMSYRFKGKIVYSAGFIAQDVEKAVKETGISASLVSYKNGYLLLKYRNFIPVIVAAIQKQQEEIDEMRRKICK